MFRKIVFIIAILVILLYYTNFKLSFHYYAPLFPLTTCLPYIIIDNYNKLYTIVQTSIRLIIRHLKVNGLQHVGMAKYTIRMMENIVSIAYKIQYFRINFVFIVDFSLFPKVVGSIQKIKSFTKIILFLMFD